MYVQLGARPQADFSRPIELMMDCHRRVEHFLRVLATVADSGRGGPLDDESRAALATALRYFESAAPRHTADEEQSLFPRMRATEDPRVLKTLRLLDELEADHAAMEPLHARVAALGDQWLHEDRLSHAEAAELVALIGRMRQCYARHIRIEDEQVFAAAKRALSNEQLTSVGREMAARRADNPGRPDSRCAQRRARMSQDRPGD